MTTQNNSKYYYALGRRKTSVATVRVFEGEGESLINNKKAETVFSSINDQAELYRPIELTGNTKKTLYFTAVAKGGGVKGQLDAIKLGIARALVKMSPDFKPLLKAEGLLTRDSRIVERKKAGLVKARKSPQFSKR